MSWNSGPCLGGPEPSRRATCHLCEPPEAALPNLLEHLRLFHPDVYGDGLAAWPDGGLVVVDATLDPADFGGRST